MAQITVENNILKMPDLLNEPKSGLGVAIFNKMKQHSEKVAQYVVETGEVDIFADLLSRSIRTALKMKNDGLKRGDIISICSHNHIDNSVPFIASTFLGVIPASLDPSLSIADTVHLIKLIKPKMIFTSVEAIDLMEKALNEAQVQTKLVVFGNKLSRYEDFSQYLQPNSQESNFIPIEVDNKETAVIFFSSGTTGLPKGICQSGYTVLKTVELSKSIRLNSRGSLGYASLYWISGVIFLAISMITGVYRVLPRQFDPGEFWMIINKYKVSHVLLTPFNAIEVIKAEKPSNCNTTHLEYVITGGGVLSEVYLSKFRKLLPDTLVSQGYGLSEIGFVTCFQRHLEHDMRFCRDKLKSCGRPLPGVWYKIVDLDNGNILGPNQSGELRLKSKCVMNGYHNLDSSNCFDEDGWLKTGDVAYYDEDFCFYIVDRIKEMLRYQSVNVVPVVLEGILETHPAVKQAVVVGIPHEIDGDHPVALVIRNIGYEHVSGEEIDEFLAERVDAKQRLRAGVKFVDSFPITPTGKVDRRNVKKMVLSGKV